MANAKDVARIFEYLGLQSEGVPIEKTRLNKLLYFAQGHAFNDLNRELFTNQIDAWDHGPVVAVVYTGFNKIVENAKKKGISGVKVSPDEMDVILDVWDQYRGYSASELVSKTHEKGTPWAETYKPHEKNTHIPKELIKQYFERPGNQLKHPMVGLKEMTTVNALPVDEYDPDEDSVWEALLNETP